MQNVKRSLHKFLAVRTAVTGVEQIAACTSSLSCRCSLQVFKEILWGFLQ